VRLCSIECCFSHPLQSCQENRSFRDDVEAWSRASDRLYIWDYVTNFAHYIMPFPNLDVLQPNVKFFVQHGVKGIFEEGNYAPGGGGEMAELRAYLLAKLLWNPDCDVAKARLEFLEAYYGPAAAPIGEYLDLLHNKVQRENIHLRIYDPPTSAYLSPDLIQRADALFDQAESLVTDPDTLLRVKVARLPIQYVKVATLSPDAPGRQQMIDDFFALVRQAGITQIREGRSLERSLALLQG
jgi:hypothetical protein